MAGTEIFWTAQLLESNSDEAQLDVLAPLASAQRKHCKFRVIPTRGTCH